MMWLFIEVNSKEKAEKIISCMNKRAKRIWQVNNNITNEERFYIYYKPISARNKKHTNKNRNGGNKI